MKRVPEGEQKGPKGSNETGDKHDHARTDSVEHRAHGDLKQGEGVEECTSENTQHFCIQSKLLNEIWGDHSIGDAIELGENKKAGENGEDEEEL